ncbi:hypothetical protein [Streptomyces sp. NBC_01306]|uniref:hypothetical protein n=1 Tax=Streptomyces sp. NBC_01306 TaxID=2903819 RepID=UPI0022568875|nr:hypothetical protein [Streptomyces sp. NBC_01306]MCX4725062.1 hypothetical protein [Streptomyces sp. NBC_01306]
MSEAETWHSLLDEVHALANCPGWSAAYSPPPTLSAEPLRVDARTTDGIHEVTAVTVRGGDDPPAYSEEQAACVRSAVRALLDLMGHESGHTTTEIALTTAGPRIMSCRVHGDEEFGLGGQRGA